MDEVAVADRVTEPKVQKGDRIYPFLWFNGNAEEAVNFYVSLLPNSRVLSITRNTEAAPGKTGDMLVMSFELEGRKFMALNGGKDVPFTDAVSFTILCDTQAEIDGLRERILGAGGEAVACGWIKDQFGLRWQITPRVLDRLLSGGGEAPNRAMAAMMGMVKLDIAALASAYAGQAF